MITCKAAGDIYEGDWRRQPLWNLTNDERFDKNVTLAVY